MENLLQKVDRYYVKQQESIKLSDNEHYNYKFMCTNEGEHIVEIYKESKLFAKATYDILGCYNIVCSIWIWGWAVSQIERNLTDGPEDKIKTYYKNLLSGKITKEIEEYLYFISNSTFFISYKTIDKLLKFCLYVTKGEFILPHKLNDDKPTVIEFMLIKKITQLHNI